MAPICPLQVEQQRDYTVDLEARKAGLRARLAAFEKVSRLWDHQSLS